MTTHFVVEVETTSPAPTAKTMDRADALVDALKPWHGAVVASPGRKLSLILTLPAEDLGAAIATALAVVGSHVTPLGVTALPEAIRDAREGWEPVPALMSVTQAAERLGLTRTRVQQMIDEGKLPGERVGTTYAVQASAVERVAAVADA